MLLRFLCILWVIAIISVQQPVMAAEKDQNRAQLEKIKNRIEKTEQNLKDKRQAEQNIARDLALLQKNLENIENRITGLKGEQRDLSKKIAAQQDVVQTGKGSVLGSRRRLELRLATLYKEGESGPLKVIFSADSPTEMMQQYHYLTVVLKRDVELLETYRADLHRQEAALTHLQELEGQHKRLLADEEEQRGTAAEAQRLKDNLLRQARRDNSKLKQQLTALKDEQTRLRSLMQKLEQEEIARKAEAARKEEAARKAAAARKTDAARKAEAPVATSPGGDLKKGRGKLPWPAAGSVIIGFGRQKDTQLGTYYESNGIEISVPAGTPIKAVADGRVVFADYFKGYGNLLIVSHSGGYHSLYAHTERMKKQSGEQVKSGEIIGYSGLGGRDSFYFELREQGSPVNPLKWLQ